MKLRSILLWSRLEKKCPVIRLVSACVLFGILLCVTGCQSQIPELTPQQEQDVKLFATQLLLRYDQYHVNRLVDDISTAEPTDPTQQNDSTQPSVPSQPNDSTQPSDSAQPSVPNEPPSSSVPDQTSVSLARFLSLPQGVTITYQGSYTLPYYPEDAGQSNQFVLYPSEGKELLFLNFTLVNESDALQSVNTRLFKPSFYIKTAEETVLTKLPYLENEIGMYFGDLQPGDFVNLILCAEITQGTSTDIVEVVGVIDRESQNITFQ